MLLRTTNRYRMAASERSATRDRRGARESGGAAPAKRDSGDTPRPRRRPYALVIVLVLIAAFGVVRSIEPFREYREVQRERADLEAQVALVEEENAAVRSEIDHLKNDSYLEALARSELNLARPGEDVFIVTGLPTTTTGTTPEETLVEPGPLEKMVSSLRRLF